LGIGVLLFLFAVVVVASVSVVVGVLFSPVVLLVVWPVLSLTHALWWTANLSDKANILPGDFVLCHYPVSSREYWWMVVPGAVLRFFVSQSVVAAIVLAFGGAGYLGDSGGGYSVFFLAAGFQTCGLFVVSMWICFTLPGAPCRRASLLLIALASLALYLPFHGWESCVSLAGWGLSPFVFGVNQVVVRGDGGSGTGIFVMSAALVVAVCAVVFVYRRVRREYEVDFPLYYDAPPEENGEGMEFPGAAGCPDCGDAFPDGDGFAASRVFDSLEDSVGMELRGGFADAPRGIFDGFARRFLGKRGEVVLDFLSAGELGEGEVFVVYWKWRVAVVFLVAVGLFLGSLTLILIGSFVLLFSVAFVFHHGFSGTRPVPLLNVSTSMVAFYPVTMREVAWTHLKTTMLKFAAWLPFGCVVLALGLRHAYGDGVEVARLVALTVCLFGAALPVLSSFELLSVKRGYKSFFWGVVYGFFVVSSILVEVLLLASVFVVHDWTWRWFVPPLVLVVSSVYFAVCVLFFWDRALRDFVHPLEEKRS
jgi:hypothetical protein